MTRVKFAIPKGSLEKATFQILEQAWYKVYGQERTYRPRLDDPDIVLKLLRPQEIPLLVAEGLHDIGIAGTDWVRETKADVEVLLDLEYGAVKLVVAVPEDNGAKNFNDFLTSFLNKRKNVRISTEYLNIASEFVKSTPIYQKYFKGQEPQVVTPWWRKGNNNKVSIFLSFGATEAKPPDETDVIFDLTETGTTLEQNNLRIIDTITSSTAALVANRSSLKDPNKREKIYDIITLLKGVVESKKKIHIFVNVRKENLKKLLQQLPALKRPTISPLSDEGWYSVNTVVDKKVFHKLLPALRKLAQGLVVHEPKQILSLEEIGKDESSEG